MLEVRDLRVRYGGALALDGLDLEIADDEVVAVLGPSGSGKSTLLRAIAGLVPTDGGSIRRDGIDLGTVPAHRRDVGLMFQDHALFPHRDVLGNVAFGLRMRGVARRQAEERAREVLELVGLGGYEHRSIRELSGGEQQRVALARALAPEPGVLMLDEPLGALDRALREDLARELRALFDRLEVAVLLVTHDQDEAFAIADRVAVLQHGRIQQIGTPTEVWRRPASEEVARFLGWNVTDALDGTRTALRPDALQIAPVGELAGVVVDQTFRRDHFLVRVALDDDAGELDVVVRAASPPPRGAAVRLRADPDGIVPLDG